MAPKEIVVSFLRAFWAADEAAWEIYLAPDARFCFAPSLGYATEAARGRNWDGRDALRRIKADLFTAFDPETELMRATVSGGKIMRLVPYSDTRQLDLLLAQS